MDLGFDISGFNTVFANEYHSPFLEIYKHGRESMNLENNIPLSSDSIELLLEQKIDEINEIFRNSVNNTNYTGFIGGPPCPDFSVGGKNRGRNGDNGKLSQTYINMITNIRPDFFLFENVKGLWRTKQHREFYNELKDHMIQEGYCLTDKLLNSISFGVPQERFRIILFGIRKDIVPSEVYTSNSYILPDALDLESHAIYQPEIVYRVPWPNIDPFVEDQHRPVPQNIIEELTVEHWFRQNDVINHPNASNHFTPRAGLEKFQRIEEGDVSKKSYKRLHRWRYSPTAAYGNNEVHLHPYKARRLSVAEALAIQSLPREFNYPQHISLTNMFKSVGNGVPFLMARGISQSINEFLEAI